MDDIVLDQVNTPEVEPVPLTQPVTAVVPDKEQANKRAVIAAYGAGQYVGKDSDTIESAILSGNEPAMRSATAAAVDEEKIQKKLDLVRKISEELGRPPTPEQFALLSDPNYELNKTTDPDTVFEYMYGKKFINTLDEHAQSMDTTVTKSAEEPSQVDKYVDFQYEKMKAAGADYIAKNKYLDARISDAKAAVEAQSYVGYGIDFAKNIFPGYNEWFQRTGIAGTGKTEGGLLGHNIEEQSANLYQLPLEQYKTELDKVVNYGLSNNPQAILSYLEALKGQTTTQLYLNNAFSTLDLAGVLGTAKGIGKVFAKGTKAVLSEAAEKTATAEAVTKYNTMVKAVKDSTEAAINPTDNIRAAAAEGAGDIKEAAVQVASREIADLQFSNSGQTSLIGKTLKYIPTVFRLFDDTLQAGKGKLSNDLANILSQDSNNTIARVASAFVDVPRIDRVPLENLTAEELRRIHDTVIKQKYQGINEAILDIGTPWKDPTTGTQYIDVQIGNIGKELFTDKNTARNFAKFHNIAGDIVEKEGSWRVPAELDDDIMRLADDGGPHTEPRTFIEQKGVGYHLRVSVPLNEEWDVMRDLLIRTKKDLSLADTGSERSKWMNGWFGKLRTSEETLSETENEIRKVSTHSPKKFIEAIEADQKFVNDVMDGVRRVDEFGNEIPWYLRAPRTFFNKTLNIPQRLKTSRQYAEFQRAVNYSIKGIDDEGKPGRWFKDPQEMEAFYQTTFGRMPDFREYRGYWAVKRMYETERLMRNFEEVANRTSIGAENHLFSMLDNEGKLIKSPAFEGTKVDRLPSSDDDVLFVGDKLANNKIGVANGQGARLKLINDMAAKGEVTIIRLYDPIRRPFNGWGGIGTQRVDYVVARNVESTPISFDQVSRREGGHFVYDTPYFLKQANTVLKKSSKGELQRADYEGDNTLSAIDNMPMGKDLANKMNEVRRLIASNQRAAAKTYVQNNLPFEWKEVSRWFKDTVDDSGKTIPARFNVHEDFVVVPTNRTIFDMDNSFLADKYGSKFKDRTKSGSPAQEAKVEFTQQRDANILGKFINEGSLENPVYKYVPADMIDPITMLNRGMSRIVHSSFMEDYKAYAVNRWLQEAGKYLKPDTNELRSTPYYFFNNANEKLFKNDTPLPVRNILLQNKEKIEQFLGVPDEFTMYTHSAAQKFADAMYSKFGPVEQRNALVKGITIFPETVLSRIKDPISFARSMTFHAKLGLGNVSQFLIQAQSFTNMLALAPKQSVTGVYGAFLHQWTRVNKNPEIVAYIDNMATKMKFPGMSSFKPGEFTEAMTELDRSGYGLVRGEYALLNNVHSQTFRQGDVRKLLDFGAVFFREGEQAVRTGSWYMAFKEWRDANPLKTITDADRRVILNRADLLNNNMTRASNATWQDGVFSLPTQFLSYQIRLAELFWGKRISRMDKARLVLYNSAMYGLPTSLGVMGIPSGDAIRQEANKRGYVVGEKFINSLIMEGAPAMGLAMITGTHYNVGDRYGIQGMTQFRDALRSDKPWWDVLGGAAYSTITGSLTAAVDPFVNKAISYINDDGKYPLKIDDFLDVFNEISSANTARKLFVALNTGKWMTKNEGYVTDVSKAQAIFMGLTSLSPQEINQMYIKISDTRNIAQWQKSAEKEAIKEIQRSVMAEGSNPDQATDYMNRAYTIMRSHGFRPEQMADTMSRAMRGYESQVEQVNRSYAIGNNIPERTSVFGNRNVRQDRLDQLEREQEVKKRNN